MKSQFILISNRTMNILVLLLAVFFGLLGLCLVTDPEDVSNVEANENDEEVYVIDNYTSLGTLT